MYWNILRHPSAELTAAATLLRPGGLVAINVPNWNSLDRRLFGAGWVGFDPPRHLYVLDQRSLTRLLQQAGFEILDWGCPFLILFRLYYQPGTLA